MQSERLETTAADELMRVYHIEYPGRAVSLPDFIDGVIRQSTREIKVIAPAVYRMIVREVSVSCRLLQEFAEEGKLDDHVDGRDQLVVADMRDIIGRVQRDLIADLKKRGFLK